MSTPYNFILNTESYDPLYDLVRRLSKSVEENSDIIGRLTKVVDVNLKYPTVPGTDTATPKREDPLRNFLEENLNLKAVSVDGRFDDIQNLELRQLLEDNYRLMKVRDAKTRLNAELISIYKAYEQLLLEVVLPQLARDVYENNAKCAERMMGSDLDTREKSEGETWLVYLTYVEKLEQTRSVTQKLLEVMDAHLGSEEVARLELQLTIVKDLIAQVKSGSLARVKSTP